MESFYTKAQKEAIRCLKIIRKKTNPNVKDEEVAKEIIGLSDDEINSGLQVLKEIYPKDYVTIHSYQYILYKNL